MDWEGCTGQAPMDWLEVSVEEGAFDQEEVGV
jgi:hypothetical protein